MKICLYSLKYGHAFSLAECLAKPFKRIFVFFAHITSSDSVAKWNDVGRDGPWATRVIDRYPMITRQSMPKSTGAATDSAAMLKVFQASLPIKCRKIVRQIANSVFTLQKSQRNRFFVFCSSLFTCLINALMEILAIVLLPLLAFFSVPLIAITIFLPHMLTVFINPLSMYLPVFLWVFCSTFTHIFSVDGFSASVTSGHQLLCIGKGWEVLRRCGKRLKALFTDLKRNIHSVSLSLYLKMRLAGGEIIRCFGSYPSQHVYYNMRHCF